jgi:hypothetical protein
MFEAFILTVQNTQQVDKDHFPDTKLKFVHEIHNKHEKNAKAKLHQFA